jgi:uncharacterized protein (DUF885 family)
MPEFFNTLPTAGMQIRRVPPAIEVGSPRGYAQSGSLDGSRPGTFYINLRDTRSWPKWALPSLNFHESVPGHLWQGATVLANQEIPLLHRNIGVPAFGEGWALYAEQLADEIGMYQAYPLGRIGMLQSFLYRAARIVMDTGMHAKGWSREQTIRYFIDTVGLDELSATSEVERYVVWPGQACSYKIGHTEFVRLRDEARARLGDRFDIKSFHDAVLLEGDMPLEVLAGLVAEWTEGRLG